MQKLKYQFVKNILIIGYKVIKYEINLILILNFDFLFLYSKYFSYVNAKVTMWNERNVPIKCKTLGT